jgi:hypothetical protein
MHRKIFNFEKPISFEIAHNGANSWYEFSNFVPEFLQFLMPQISNEPIRERISSIVYEELGEGNRDLKHSILYKQALNEIGITINDETTNSSLLNYQNKIAQILLDNNDPEALSVGLAYGLEIIAEENIQYLLKYSSFNHYSHELLSKSIFFKIHLQNEIEHIRKGEENLKTLLQDGQREIAFQYGVNLSLEFWKEFWLEAVA